MEKEGIDELKRLVVFFGGILLILSILFVSKTWLAKETAMVSEASENTVIIFNWGEYIDPELLKAFEKESGYHVIYNTFDSNEAMETKIKQGGTRYDVVFPSESIIPKMIEGDLLVPIDHSKIKGIENLSSFLMNQNFDENNQYSLPYFWGTIGIMVNTDEIEAGAIQKWANLWEPTYQNDILMVDGARESIGIALQAQGLSLNELEKDKIERGVKN